jgi:magnesium-protoporphyrin O-methyltransferase
MAKTDAALHKSQLQAYFDGVGFERWSAIYGQGDLSQIRHTIREGHDQMMAQAQAWLLESTSGGTLLDAGCGTGLFSLMMAQHGFDVTGIDIAPRMIDAAQAAAERETLAGSARFEQGDVESISGQYDAVTCFDVLVHYPQDTLVPVVQHLAQATNGPLLFTYAPYSRLMAALFWIGGHFPQGQRRQELQMIPDNVVEGALADAGMVVKRTTSISHGFYHVKLLEAARKQA